MAYMIVASECSGCTACEVECPNAAISEKVPVFVIKAEKCSECIGFFDEPQCLAVCPAPGAIVINENFPRYPALAA